MKKAVLFAMASSIFLTACGQGTPTPVPELTSSSPASVSASASKSAEQTKIAPTKTAEPSKTAEATKAPAPTKAPSTGEAATALDALKVNDSLSTGYERDSFGPSWPDIDNNGCDTRNDILAAHMAEVKTSDGCKVSSGVLKDSYTGEIINFSSDRSGGGVDIDHVVALSAGWKTGMSDASTEMRQAFANDPLNLLPVDAGLNRFKSDKDASEWIPSYGKSNGSGVVAEFDCPYVARQIAVKAKYSLWVTSSEKTAMKTVLSDCPEAMLPTGGVEVKNLPKASDMKTAPPKTEATKAPSKTTAPKSKTGTDPDMGSCAKAKAAGYGPYTKGQTEYGFYRDGDGDGSVCE